MRYRRGRGAADKRFNISRLPTQPVLDGKLDDPAWRSAAVLADLHEVNPDEYDPPSKNTRIYIGYDDHALYVAARMFEDRPEDVNAFIMKQGAALDDDRFVLMLDPFNKGRSGYIFELNAFGVRDDGLFQDTTNQNWDWEGIWQGQSRIDEQGWVAEMRIPFKTLSFDPNNDTWGINFARFATRQQEQMGWMSRNRSQDPSSFGHAKGFKGLSQGFGLDLVPGMALSRRRDFLPQDTTEDFEPSWTPSTAFLPPSPRRSRSIRTSPAPPLMRCRSTYPDSGCFFQNGATSFFTMSISSSSGASAALTNSMIPAPSAAWTGRTAGLSSPARWA